MLNILKTFYKKFSEKGVKTIYYCYSDRYEIHDPYICDEILYIHGHETRIPGILKKTVEAMDYFRNEDFHYTIRSNISTVINFDLLLNKLNECTLDYAAGLVFSLCWTCPEDGLIDDRFFGYTFGSGTSIVFSKKIVDSILLNRDDLFFNIIDDVAFGIFMRMKFPEISIVNIGHFIGHFEEVDIRAKNIIFYRFKHPDRNIDIEMMKGLVDYLQDE